LVHESLSPKARHLTRRAKAVSKRLPSRVTGIFTRLDLKTLKSRRVAADLSSLDSTAGLWQFFIMDADERDIFHFLKSWGSGYISAKEICRRAAGKRRFNDEPEWAKPVLLRMEERGILESDASGHFRIKPIRKSKHRDKDEATISADIAKILQESGVKVEQTIEESGLGPDEYYDQL
jgi:hypothetical protein